MKKHFFIPLLLFVFFTSIINSQGIKIKFESRFLKLFGERINSCTNDLVQLEIVASDSFNKVQGRIQFSLKLKIPAKVNSFKFFTFDSKEYYFSNRFEDESIEDIKKKIEANKGISAKFSGKGFKLEGIINDSFAQVFMFKPFRNIVSNVDKVIKRFNMVLDLSIDPELLLSFIIPFQKNSSDRFIDCFDGRIAFVSDIRTEIKNSGVLIMLGLNRKNHKLKEIISWLLKLLYPTYETEDKYVRKFILFDQTIYFTITPDRFILLSNKKTFLYKSEHKIERLQEILKEKDKKVLKLVMTSDGLNRIIYSLLKIIDSNNIEIVNQMIPFYYQKLSIYPKKITDLQEKGIMTSRPFFFLMENISFKKESLKFEITRSKSILEFSKGFGLKNGIILLKLYRSDTGLRYNVEFDLENTSNKGLKGLDDG